MAETKKQRKWGRNRASAQNLAYRNELRHERSHIRRISRHMRRYGYSFDAASALLRYAEKVSLTAVRSAKALIEQAREVI